MNSDASENISEDHKNNEMDQLLWLYKMSSNIYRYLHILILLLSFIFIKSIRRANNKILRIL